MKLEAVLVSLNISRFSNNRADDSITKEVKAIHAMTGKAGKWVKHRFDPDVFAQVQHVCSQARATHYRLTLAWEPGKRLLPLKGRERYDREMGEVRAKFVEAVAQFIAKYPEHVEFAKVMHGNKFNAAEYPPLAAMEAQFGFATEFFPVPAAAHFNDLLSGAVLQQMRESLEKANVSRLNAATADLWERILAPLERMVSILTSDAGGKCPTFRDSLVSNVTEVLDECLDLNVTGDRKVIQAARTIRSLMAMTNADSLRTSKSHREAIADGAGKVLRILSAMSERVVATDEREMDLETTYVSKRKIAA